MQPSAGGHDHAGCGMLAADSPPHRWHCIWPTVWNRSVTLTTLALRHGMIYNLCSYP